MMMPNPEVHPKRQERPPLSPELDRISRLDESEVTAEYGVLAKEHAVSEYVTAVFKRFVPNADPQVEVIVLPNHPDMTAFSLAHGKLVVTTEFLNTIEYEEELGWVLKHEYTHWDKQHSQKKRDASKRVPGERTNIIKGSLTKIGIDRMSEYEADLREDSGDDPSLYGGMVFLGRLIDIEAQRNYLPGENLTHGSSMERLVNLYMSARTIDQATLSRNLTPVNEGILNNLTPERSFTQRATDSIIDPRTLGKKKTERIKVLHAATESQMALVAKDIYADWKKRFDQNSTTDSAKITREYAKEFAKIAVERVNQDITKKLKENSVESRDRGFIRGVVAELRYGLPVCKDGDSEDSPLRVFSSFHDHFNAEDEDEDENEDEIQETFDAIPRLFTSMGDLPYALKHDPYSVIEHCVNAATKAGYCADNKNFSIARFLKYSRTLIEALQAAYEKKGTNRKINWKKMLSRVAGQIFVHIDPREAATVFQDLIQDAAIDQYTLLDSLPKNISVEFLYKHISAETITELEANLSATPIENILRITRSISANDVLAKRFINEEEEDQEKQEKIRKRLQSLFQEQIVALSHYSWSNLVSELHTATTGLSSDEMHILFYQLSLHSEFLFADDKPYMADATNEAEKYARALLLSRLLAEKAPGLMNEYVPIMHRGITGKRTGAKENPEQEKKPAVYTTAELEKIWDTFTDQSFYRSLGLPDAPHIDLSLDSDIAEVYENAFLRTFHDMIDRGVSREEIFSQLEQLFEKRAPVTTDVTIDNQAEGFRLVNRLLENYTFDPGNIQHMQELLTLASYINTPDTSSQLQEYAIAQMRTQLNPEELEKILFDDRRTRFNALLGPRSQFLNEDVRAPKQLDQSIERIQKSAFLDDQKTQEQMGRMILVNEMSTLLRTYQENLIFAGLDSKRDDTLLRAIFATLVYNFVPEEYESTTDIDKKNSLRVSPKEGAVWMCDGIDRIADEVYGMDDSTRHVLVRTLLIGPNGMLKKSDQMKRLLNGMCEREFATAQNETEKKQQEAIRETLLVAAKKGDTATIYFMLAPVFEKRLFRRPEKRVRAESILRQAQGFGDLDSAEIPPLAIEMDSRWEQSDKQELQPLLERAEPTDAAAQRHKTRELVRGYTKQTSVGDTEPMRPIQLVKQIASRLGAPGVRMLQVIGQYLPLEPEVSQDLSEVYDSVPGQNKLSGYYTLRREWKAVREELFSLGKELGGGAMATVWEAETKNGPEVVKVQNPNASFFVDTFCDLLNDTFTDMSGKYAQESRMSVLAVEDIRQWLHADIQYDGFLQRDRLFYENNNNFRTPGNQYSIQVPKSYGENSRYYQREERIEGKNLTKLEALKNDGHDMKSVAHLVVSNMMHQISKGQVHSDFHPGNIRVTAEKRVAILDRNLFIDLEPAEQILIGQLAAGDLEGAIEAFGNYLGGLKKNTNQKNIGARLQDKIQSKDLDTTSAFSIAEIIANAKEMGVHVPLKVTLLVKNFLALNKFCQDVGFTSMQDAMMYSPSEE